MSMIKENFLTVMHCTKFKRVFQARCKNISNWNQTMSSEELTPIEKNGNYWLSE